jgi:hypothetical protein
MRHKIPHCEALGVPRHTWHTLYTCLWDWDWAFVHKVMNLMGSKKSRTFHDCQQLLTSEDRHCSMQFVVYPVIALWRLFWYSVLDIQDHLPAVDVKLQSYLSNFKSDIFIILFFIFLQSKFWICVIWLLKNKLTAFYSPKAMYTCF